MLPPEQVLFLLMALELQKTTHKISEIMPQIINNITDFVFMRKTNLKTPPSTLGSNIIIIPRVLTTVPFRLSDEKL